MRECFEPDFDWGLLMWRDRPVHHFNRLGYAAHFNSVHSGKIAGRLNTYGYMNVCVSIAGVPKNYLTHRLLWALKYDAWPRQTIDHINGVKVDNRIVNLRDVSPAENMRNRPNRPNAFGAIGVSAIRNRFMAKIAGRYLGTFKTVAEAGEAYRVAAEAGENRAD
jgi:hypothetical protein